MKQKILALLGAFVWIAAIAPAAIWVNQYGAGNGRWDTGSNWDTGNPPGSAEATWIYAANLWGAPLIDSATTAVAGQLYLNPQAGGVPNDAGIINMTGGTLTSTRVIVGEANNMNTTAQFNLSGGTATFNTTATNAVGSVQIGGASATGQTGGRGKLTVSGGTFQTTAARITFGYRSDSYGEGVISGGLVSAANAVVIGEDGIANVTVSGGELKSGGTTNVTVASSGSAKGTLNVSGAGTVTAASQFELARTASTEGTVNMTGGTISSGANVVIGLAGKGTLTMSGGTIQAGNAFIIGQASGSQGYVTLSGGVIKVLGPLGSAGFVVGRSAGGSTAVLTLTGGVIEAINFTVYAGGIVKAATDESFLFVYTRKDSGGNIVDWVAWKNQFLGHVAAGYIRDLDNNILTAANIKFDDVNYTMTFIPEPATLAILGLGSLMLLRRRK